jgi:hypothetical protein
MGTWAACRKATWAGWGHHRHLLQTWLLLLL